MMVYSKLFEREIPEEWAISYSCERFGNYEIYRIADENETILVQTDWDWPGVASTFGWSPCHNCTDGTVDCRECGKTASTLIAEAAEYLDSHEGAIAEDPGYFA